jgi:3-oxoacyl-[acyl-carrier protein] reductase
LQSINLLTTLKIIEMMTAKPLFFNSAPKVIIAAFFSYIAIGAAEAMSVSVLHGKNVLVTGGGRGIGRAIAHICAKEGATVAIFSRTKSELEETISSYIAPSPNSGGTIIPYVVDVKDEKQVENTVSTLSGMWGGSIDVLINNAGRGHSKKKSYEMNSSELKDLLNLNVVSVHSVTSAVLRHSMLEKKSGRIVNISSKAGKVGIDSMSFYVSSKFALEGYSATLAEELKEHNIFVNSISPGMVDTTSFPKAPGKKGVRTAESIKDGLLLLLETDRTGHYLHVDELDQVKEKGLPDSAALKSINEPTFLA